MRHGLTWFIVRRLLLGVALVFLVSSGALLLVHLAPGDYATELMPGRTAEAVAAERHRLGLDRPFLSQYAAWLLRAATFDLGTSFKYDRPVRDLVVRNAANTALLALASLGLATVIGLPLGVYTGSHRRGWVSRLVRTASIVGVSVPPLVTSLGFVLLAARTGWFPIGGLPDAIEGAGLFHRVLTLGWFLTLPSLALALPVAATLERIQAQALSEAMEEPFIAAAAARGLSRARIVWKHALRPALTPVLGIYGIVIGSLFSGSFAVEIVTNWPGLGRLMYDALFARDTYLAAGCASAVGLLLACGMFLSDLALAAVDPRSVDPP